MSTLKRNKEFIIQYFNAISGVTKTPTLLGEYITDEKLIAHIQFFEGAFPKYELFIDEIIAEGDQVVVRARTKGRHEGELNGIPATHKDVLFPFVVGYQVENNKIISHWLIGDQMMLMEQLGVINQPA